MGVRVFSDGRNPQDKQSLAVQRRVPRGQRRRRDRYLQRRADLLDALVACGLMPPDENARKVVRSLIPTSSERGRSTVRSGPSSWAARCSI